MCFIAYLALFLFYPVNYFIAYLTLFLSYFFPPQPYFFPISFLPSPISFLFLSCPFVRMDLTTACASTTPCLFVLIRFLLCRFPFLFCPVCSCLRGWR